MITYNVLIKKEFELAIIMNWQYKNVAKFTDTVPYIMHTACLGKQNGDLGI